MERWNTLSRPVRAGLAAAFAAVTFCAVPSVAQAPSLKMLDRIEGGLWEVRVRDAAGIVRRLCLQSGRPLIQLKHPNSLCRSFVVEDTAQAVTVHYTCPGNGYGRTRVRYENPQLVQIESQGIAERYPFDLDAEGRRIGACHE